MLILDPNDDPIWSVLLMLTPDEARKLHRSLEILLAKYQTEPGYHLHVNDLNVSREITLAIYTENNLSKFSRRIESLLKEEQ